MVDLHIAGCGSPWGSKTNTVKIRRMLHVWASGSNAPLSVCEDARLRGGAEWSDATYGQAGWDWGINFGDFDDLIRKLRGAPPKTTCGNVWDDCDPLGDGELGELAINCHGASGVVDINCGSTTTNGVADLSQVARPLMDIGSLPKYRSHFDTLNRLLAPQHGVLFFMCCLTGQFKAGEDFLIAVSKMLPGREIMAIATIGYSDTASMVRPGVPGHAEPGMRDTVELWASNTPSIEAARYNRIWNDLSALPWASRTSPHTKIARDGVITKRPPPIPGTTPGTSTEW
jgi:hypothetical protein